GIPCVNYGEIHSKYGFKVNPEKDELLCVDEKYLETNPSSLLSNGHFVFADTSEDIEGSGNFTHLIGNHKIFAGYHTIVSRLKINAHPRYVAYFFDSVAYRNQIRSEVQGVKVFSITNKILKDTILFFPELTEQVTIANHLDYQTQKIDRLIANKKAQAEKLKELRQLEINNAVTKGLNPNNEMKDSSYEWLGEIPSHWEVRKIKQLLKPEKNAIKTGPFGSDLKFEDLIEEGIKVYNQRSVLDNDWESGEGYISEKKYETLKTCTIYPDDIVITTRGTIGKVSIFPSNAELGILHPCLMRIQMNSKRILKDYLKIIINDSSFFFEALKLASNATTIDVIYSESLKEVKIPVPPIQEQIEITSYLQKRIGSTDKLIKNIQVQIEKLQGLRKIKIYEAVTGKIKINAYVEATA
ncbi:MAG: restriction endonuclease subunit S, partial [Bacteroidia bacterium]